MSKFVWCEYVSPDAPRAQNFFGELFGWTTLEASQGGYTMLANEGRPIGGYAEGPARWQPFLQTWNLGDSIERVKLLGGKIVREPFVVGAMGRQAVVSDPLGGTFCLWQPAKTEYDGVDFWNKAGGWVWYELYTQDADASLAFYRQVGNFTHTTQTIPTSSAPSSYHILEADGRGRAGIITMPHRTQSWMPYVQVEHPDALVAKATQLGAQIAMEPRTMPGVGRMAQIVDPQGAHLGVLQPMR